MSMEVEPVGKKRISGPTPLFTPPRPCRIVPAPRRSLIYWPAVGLAASAGVTLISAVLICVVRLPARASQPQPIALAAPTVEAPNPSVPADQTALVDQAPPSPQRFDRGIIPLPAPEPVAPVVRKDDADHFDAPPLASPPQLDSPPADPPQQPAAATCQTFGTSVAFAVSPAAATKQAVKDGKLLFLLHVSGDFEDDAFT